MVIRKIGVGSAAKVFGALYGLMGLVFGAIFACISLVGAGIASTIAEQEGSGAAAAMASAFFGVGAIVVLPILYGVMGLIFGALTAAIYNIVAGFAGGDRGRTA